MKSHIVIKLRLPATNKFPSWQSILSQKQAVPTTLESGVDAVLHVQGVPVWVTTEFEPASPQQGWTQTEVDSGFNRTYRLIAQIDKVIPQFVLEALQQLPSVERAHLGGISQTEMPQTVAVSQSFSLSEKYRPNGIWLQEAHQWTQGNESIKVAVLDTGVDIRHPEISHAILRGSDWVNIIDGSKDFVGDYLDADDNPDDEVGHGTHVSGIIAGKGIQMPIGVAPKCKILPVRVLGAYKKGNSVIGAGLIDNINNGIKWAVDNGADVINMSLGIKNTGGGLPHQEVIQYAIKKGVTIIAASGNDGSNELYYPGALPNVIAIGATDDSDNMAVFSTFGSHVSFVAPGTAIFSSYMQHGYMVSSGTSQASPFVTGTVALLKSYALTKGKKLTDTQIKYILYRTANRIDSQPKHPKAGYGKINIIDALKLLKYKLDFS
jgi:thermitase